MSLFSFTGSCSVVIFSVWFWVVFFCQTYHAVQDTKAYNNEREVTSIHGTIECEQPQPDLYKSVELEHVIWTLTETPLNLFYTF